MLHTVGTLEKTMRGVNGEFVAAVGGRRPLPGERGKVLIQPFPDLVQLLQVQAVQLEELALQLLHVEAVQA